MNPVHDTPRAWCFSRKESIALVIGLIALLAFGANVERRTALRRTPMTDLGVFSCAAGAVCSGENLYAITDWHGWHYQYPPALAILFTPLAVPVPTGPPPLAKGETRTESNTPWGYDVPSSRSHYYGLRADNARFFWIVAVWYIFSVALILFSTHALSCALEKCHLRDPPPTLPSQRRRWWLLRTLPLLVCAGSLGTDLSRGQVDVLMLAAISLGIYLAASGRAVRAGFWLSLPAAVKLFPVLLMIYPVWRRQWRIIAGVVAGLTLALVIVPAIVLGPARAAELSRMWVEVLAKPALGQSADPTRTRELTGMAGTDNQSLLAFIHNWRYHDLPREKRPQQAPPVERYISYAIGALMLLGVTLTMGRRRPDSPRDVLIIAGLLIGVALVVNPVSHNYYFLLLLPLVMALLDRGLEDPGCHASDLKPLLAVAAFMFVDMLARFQTVGPWLRDAGFPLLSMVGIMVVGAVALRANQPSPLNALPNQKPLAPSIA